MKREKSILVVDDSVTTRDFISSILTDHGFAVISVENGKIALEELNKHKFHCVIADLLMPVMDGFELLKELHDREYDVPVIIVTADIQDEVKEECFSLGAKGFLNKPITDPSALINTVNDHLK